MNDEGKRRMADHCRLALDAKNGDEEAISELYDKLHFFILQIVAEYDKMGNVNRVDIPRMGWEAIRKSVKNFDPDKSPNFMSYFKRYMRNKVIEEIRGKILTIRVPYEAYKKKKKCLAAIEELIQATGTTPSNRELAEYVDLPLRTVERVLLSPIDVDRLDAEDDSGVSRIAQLKDDNTEDPSAAIDREMMIEYAEHLFDQVLNEREIIMIKKRYLEGKSLNEISDEHSITTERVRQIILRAIDKIQRKIREEGKYL